MDRPESWLGLARSGETAYSAIDEMFRVAARPPAGAHAGAVRAVPRAHDSLVACRPRGGRRWRGQRVRSRHGRLGAGPPLADERSLGPRIPERGPTGGGLR